ncbi:MAG TPA: LCP family protein [Solirubrobacteraceae bacterium]|jgi:LCP family protein required for cell wall assembly|nr:LCP family protein [Solirubrobacteraceae bacterium]
MPRQPTDRPQYKRYRASPRLPARGGEADAAWERGALAREGGPPNRPRRAGEAPPGSGSPWHSLKGTGERITPRRVLLGLLALLLGWLVLSALLFLLSAHFERTSPPSDVAAALKPSGYPLTSPNNVLVLGSDRRPKGSREPGANTSGPSRSDTMMLIRTGGGHSARLSIPRDTVVDVPGYGLNKINSAYAFGGPALSIRVVEELLHVPINHLVEVNFEDFPALIDAMGGVDYTGGCLYANIDGGAARGGFTLHLSPGTHRLDGREALALARTRENLCAPNQTDIQREEHQQALFNDMKGRLESVSSFIRLPLIAWNAPPAIVSDMSGPTLLGLFAALAVDGTPPTRVLRPDGTTTLPDGEVGLTVSAAERRAAAARFLAR